MRVIPLFLCYVLLWAGRVSVLTLVVRDTSAPAPKTGTPAQWQAHMKALQDEAQADWRTMMDSLHLDTLRPYVDGMDPHAAHVPNYGEALANPYPDLPDPLKLRNGNAVSTAAMWWKLKRPEIVSAFDREVYGITPSHVPAVHWVVVSTEEVYYGTLAARVKHLKGVVDNTAFPSDTVNIDLTLTTPSKVSGAVPVIMALGYGIPKGYKLVMNSPDSIWQQRVLAKGWGYAELIPSSIQADGGFGLTRGIIGLVNQGRRRSPTDWGALKAWAWGVNRAIDYFETDKEVDAHQVGMEGHSRFGKAALVAVAYDPRMAIAYISSSGEGGAKLSRRNYGEIVENLASSGEYHWMCGNILKSTLAPCTGMTCP